MFRHETTSEIAPLLTKDGKIEEEAVIVDNDKGWGNLSPLLQSLDILHNVIFYLNLTDKKNLSLANKTTFEDLKKASSELREFQPLREIIEPDVQKLRKIQNCKTAIEKKPKKNL